MKHKLKGLSLMEVLVVLLIIGIITNLVLPKLLPLITRAKSMEAKLQLNHLYTLQQNYFLEHSRYSQSLDEIGFEQEKTISEGGKANYRVRITSSSSSHFIAEAVAVADFDNDGIFNTWQINKDQVLTELIKD